jgi:hypothetical protein
MNRNDPFAAETIFVTELQNGKNSEDETPGNDLGNILERQQMFDLQMPSFIRGD